MVRKNGNQVQSKPPSSHELTPQPPPRPAPAVQKPEPEESESSFIQPTAYEPTAGREAPGASTYDWFEATIETEKNVGSAGEMIDIDEHIVKDVKIGRVDSISDLEQHIFRDDSLKADEHMGDLERYGDGYDNYNDAVGSIGNMSDLVSDNSVSFSDLVGEQLMPEPAPLNLAAKKKTHIKKVTLDDMEDTVDDVQSHIRSIRLKNAFSYGLTHVTPLLIAVIIMFVYVWPRLILPLSPSGKWEGVITATDSDPLPVQLTLYSSNPGVAGDGSFRFYQNTDNLIRMNVPKTIGMWYTDQKFRILGHYSWSGVTLSFLRPGEQEAVPTDIIFDGSFASMHSKIKATIWQNEQQVAVAELTRRP